MKKFIFAVLLGSLASLNVFAAGMTTHEFITETALKNLADPELKQVLKSHRNVLLTACNFPDTGTANRYLPGQKEKPNYGGITHWPVYTESYLAYIGANCHAPYDRRCIRLIDHFMGLAAHDMEDQAFDELFLAKAAKVAAPEMFWMVDATSDFVVLAKYDRWAHVPVYVAPVKDLSRIFSDMGLDFSEANIVSGHIVHQIATVGERPVSFFSYLPLKKRMPWISSHIYAAPGGVVFAAGVIDEYWEALWQRINGKGGAIKPVIASLPAAGASDVPLDSEVNVFFARGKISASITPASFLVRDGAGKLVEGKIRNSGKFTGDEANFVPSAPLLPGRTYTVILTTGIEDLDGPQDMCKRFNEKGGCVSDGHYVLRGKPMSAEYSFSFTTAKESK